MPAVADNITLPASFTVLPGQYLVIDFSYNSDPLTASGGSDVLLINGGGVSQDVTNSSARLYHDGQLLGTFTNSQPNTYAAFRAPQSAFNLQPSALVNLGQIFTGGESEIVFQPNFSSIGPASFIDYQPDFFGSAQGNNVNMLASPDSLKASVVPLSSSLGFLLSGILGVLAFNSRRLMFSCNRLSAALC